MVRQSFGCMRTEEQESGFGMLHRDEQPTAAGDESEAQVFRALADSSRRLLLDSLNVQNGQSLQELCAGLQTARQSISKHLAILEEANLVTTVRVGRRKLHYLNAVPINEIAERWIGQYDLGRVQALHDLKKALEAEVLEEEAMDNPEFVYKTYIKTTPEQLWKALTEPAFTERYWGVRFETDWQKGSEMTWVQKEVAISEPEQVVLESNPYSRLSYTWHTFTPEWAEVNKIDQETLRKYRGERRSKVTFEIEPVGELIRLTVVHDGFGPGGAVLEGIREGWPWILASLKTLLETGDELPT
jgi:uncharacterized protein YndB with AHSA1/START domain/DNA-binding transcriptional ArsR family regulator